MPSHGSVVTYKVSEEGERNSGDSSKRKLNLTNIYLNHVYGNSTDQIAFSVCAILDLVFRKQRELVPSISKIIIECENATSYANNLFPVLAPFICLKYNIQIHRLMHSETEDAKGPAGVHVACAMRYVDCSIETKRIDVVTPTDLVSVLN